MQTMTEVEGMESVAPDDQPVADVPAQPAADSESDRLKAKLAEANKHAKAAQQRAKEEERRAQAETQRALEATQKLEELEAQRLAGQGEHREAAERYRLQLEALKGTYASALARITELEHQLELERTSTQTERLRAAAIARISDAGARKPDQLLKLLDLVDYDGQPAVIKGGVEVPLDQYLGQLKQPGSDWEHHFLPTAKKGMGTPTASPGGVPAPGEQQNPYAPGPGQNLTMQMMLEATQPELAAALKAEAGVG